MLIFSLVAFVLGAALSFLSVGVFWTGVSPWFQLGVAFLFFIVTLVMNKFIKSDLTTIVSTLSGAAPMGLIIPRFRDSNGSHLIGILIIISWVAAVAAGAKLKLTNKGQND